MKPYFEEDGISIYNSDCLEVMPDLDPVDVVLTDPPYESEAHTLQRRLKRGGKVMEEPLPFGAIDEATRNASALEMCRLARRWLLTFCQIEGAPLWRASYEAFGFRYMRTCIWVKPDGQPQLSGDRPGMGYETILAMHSKGASRWNGGGKHGVFIHNKQDNNGGLPNEHPTMKPSPLINELVGLFSDQGETILDPFMGSGTTLRAAKDLGRRGIGIEIEEKYCEIAAKRLAQKVFDFQ